MVYSAEVRGRLLGVVTDRELTAAETGTEQPGAKPEAGRGSGPWEVLNAQEVYSVPSLRAVADRHGVPLVLTLHGYPLYESLSEGYTAQSAWGRGYLMGAEMRALRLADAIVTVDSRLYRHVLKLVPERAAAVSALMNFIDTSSFFPTSEGREGLRAKWDIPPDRVVLFCPRRLVKKNGVVYPALALASMGPADRRRFLLLHAGEGGERPGIEQVVREAGLQAEVRMLGGQDRDAILELFRLADIVLVPSVHSENVEEATSLSALEAMASGRPLIAGDVGGLAEMVDDGLTGLLVPAADERALAAAILRLAADPALGAALAARARDYVVTHHSHTRAAAEYVEVYRSSIEGRASTGAVRSAGGGAATGAGTSTSASPSPGSVSAVPAAPAPDGPTDPFASLPQVSILGFPLHLVDRERAAALLLDVAAGVRGGPTRIAVSFNPELIVGAQDDPAAAEAVLAADLRFPDGVGAVWAAARQGVPGLERVPGIELAESLLAGAAAAGLPVYLLGAAEGVAAEAGERLSERFPGLVVAGTHQGYFAAGEDAHLARTVRASGAAVLLAALGAPRQEVFLHRRRMELGVAVAMGVGGSFDVWAGRVERAPEWTHALGVEWLYRLATDPKRARRQLALPRFAFRVMEFCPDDYGPGRARRGGEPGTGAGASDVSRAGGGDRSKFRAPGDAGHSDVGD